MAPLTWDQVGDKLYETGVDHGVLYLPDDAGVYNTGFAWNGLTTVTESPSGADATPQYADNIKYLNLVSAEEFGGTIEAFTYPEEFAVCDGTALPAPGVAVGQQGRKMFGLSYQDQGRKRCRRKRLWLQAASHLWCFGRSVGEGLRDDQRFTGRYLVQLGDYDYACSCDGL